MVQKMLLPEDPGVGYEWKGAEKLRPMLVPIGMLREHPRNVRKGDVERLAWSLNHFGQMVPLIVQSATPDGEQRNVIVKGNHTFKAALAIGWREIAVVFDVLDDTTAHQYLLADNRASDLATYDKEALREGLQALSDAGQLQDTMWTMDDLDDLTSALGTLETVYKEFEGDYSDDPATRAARAEREQTRVATKMREVPVVITVEQHVIFMDDIRVLQKHWHTGGAIETILLAVSKQAALVRGATPEPALTPAPADPSATPAVVGPQRGPVGGTAHEEATLAPHRTLEGWPVDDKNNLLPEAKAELWFKVGSSFMATLYALKADPIRKTVVYGILEAVGPGGPRMSVPNAERHRTVTAIRDAIIQDYVDVTELAVGDILGIVARICPQPIRPIRE